MDRLPLERLRARAYSIPTDLPESDGTLAWDSTTVVVVEASAGGITGLGYTYTHAAAATLVDDMLAGVVLGRDVSDVPTAWSAMVGAVRNTGRPGIASMAISAVDVALWDLKAKVLGLALADLLGRAHETAPCYGSGGFTSYSHDDLETQLGGWADAGLRAVKIKVGRHPDEDEERLRVARKAIGDRVELFVDANGAHSRKEAIRWASQYAQFGVRWYEEPVTADDLEGLRLVRDHAPDLDVAAGEYGFDLPYFRRMLEAGAVDCLQVDPTRCGGVTGFLRAAALCDAHTVDLSAHCAPQISAHLGCAAWHFRHLEWFHDHVRVERLVFDGTLDPYDSALPPDPARPGLGIELREDADRWAS